MGTPPEPARVVVVGYRRGLGAALARRGVEFALWHPIRRAASRASTSWVSPIGRSPRRVRAAAEHLAPSGPFTHVIAGTESAVVPAAMLRRQLGARQSPVTRVLRCHDKLEMKRHLARHGIPMTAFRGGGESTAEQLLRELGAPVVVKARTSSGGRGIAFADDPEALRAIPRRGRYFERWVDGDEASVESFVHRGRIGFTNVTSYLAKEHVNLVPGEPRRRARGRPAGAQPAGHRGPANRVGHDPPRGLPHPRRDPVRRDRAATARAATSWSCWISPTAATRGTPSSPSSWTCR